MLKFNCKKVFEVNYQVSPREEFPEVVCVFFGTYIMTVFNDYFGGRGEFVSQEGRIYCGFDISPERIQQAVEPEDYEEIMYFMKETGWEWRANEKCWTRACAKRR